VTRTNGNGSGIGPPPTATAEANLIAKGKARKKWLMLIDAYISNGGNKNKAAETVGYAPSTATGIFKDKWFKERLAARQMELAEKFGMTAEKTVRETARIAYADPLKVFNPDGTLKPIHEIDEDTRAAIASIKVKKVGMDSEGKPEYEYEIRFWDKVSALDKSHKHLGLYEAENSQKNIIPVVLGPGDENL